MNRSVVHRFLEAADRHSARPALWARGDYHSFAELSALAETIRGLLVERGLRGPRRIGIVTGDGPVPYAAMLAVLAGGSAYVPINGKNPLARNLAVLEESGVAALVYETPCELVRAVGEGAVAGCELVQAPGPGDDSGELLRLDWTEPPALAYLFFTSGSTGKPKGVPISHANLDGFMAVMLEEGIYDFAPDDRFLQMFELTFDLSVMSLFVPLSVGACCYVVPESRVGAAMALKVLQQQDISVALMVPSLLVSLEPYLERVRLPQLRLSMFCGEALPDSLVQKWHGCAPASRIENVYGPTEATIFCLRYPWDPAASPAAAVNGIVPIGRPLPGTDALVLAPDGRPSAAPGARGELLLAGRQLSAGYWSDATRTAAAYITVDHDGAARRAYRSGDICSIDPQGDFVYHGRLDTQVKIDGHRVELGEIEHHVRDVLGRANLAVVLMPEGSRRLPALCLERPEIDAEALQQALRTRLPDYMLPRRVAYVEALPLNLNGKVDRPRLVEMLGAT